MKGFVAILMFLVSVCGFSQNNLFGVISNQLSYIESPGAPITFKNAAFPTAYGYGSNATGGRGGYVVRVTNLNDSGAGSLRQAVEVNTGARTVVFDVSGYINLTTPLKVRDGYGNLTILGQTSPDGIALKGASIWIHDSNVIIRHLKVRPGKDAWTTGSLPTDPDYEPDDGIKIQAFSGAPVENVILDHVTVTWARDGTIDIGSVVGTDCKNITIQESILGENIDKGYGVLLNYAYNVTFYRNLITQCKSRVIATSSIEGEGSEMVNNIVYGFNRGTWMREGNEADIIGNVYQTSPASVRADKTVKMEASAYNVNLSRIYITDNLENGGAITVEAQIDAYLQPNAVHTNNLNILANGSVESTLLPIVGASLYRDAADTRMINDVTNRTGGFITDETTVGGYPTIGATARGAGYDTDDDGMADSWEVSTFGDLSKTATGKNASAFYDNLEMFSFSLVGEL